VKSEEHLPKTAVVGLGNVLMADDAFGPTFVRWLEANYEVPESIEVIDLGTPGNDLYPHLVDRDVVIVVDTVRFDGAPGTLRVYTRDEIVQHVPHARVSPHDPGLKETLLSLEFAGHMPRQVLLVGVIPESTGSELGLSEAVRSSIESAGEAVVEALRREGHAVPRREVAEALDLWWEKPVPPSESVR